MSLAAGTRLGPYEVTAQIGLGGMGEVYRARDTRLGRTVAIKVLRSGGVASVEERQRLLGEARAVSALNHRAIVTLYDVGQQDGNDYLVLEHVEGSTLDQRIPPGGMKLDEALRVAISIADAVAAAHGAGILHRDLKPANIMVADSGAVKVLDFGIAQLAEPKRRAESEATMTMTPDAAPIAAGTPAYMSPEQAEAKRIDARSDVFSFGSMLYEMLTGQRAFVGDSTASVLASVLKETPRPARQITPGLPRDLERLLERCLRKDPARRLASMHDVRVELEDIRDSPPEAALAAPSAAAAAGFRFHRWWAGSLALAVALGVAGGSYLGRPRGPGPRRMTEPAPLTSYQGAEFDPEFSPDGSQVAFTWTGADYENLDIYVKIPGTGTPLRLTTDPAQDTNPAWSPDGTWIYFLRAGDGGGLYRVSPIGGAESRLGSTHCVSDLAWTPRGDALTCMGVDAQGARGAWAVPKDGGEERLLLAGARVPRVSPDGRRLLFTLDDGYTDLHTIDLDDDLRVRGAPAKWSNEQTFIYAAAWISEGREAIAAMGGGMADSRLYRFGPVGMRPFLMPFSQPHTFDVAASRDGTKFAWATQSRVRRIWSIADGTLEPHPVSSTRVDYNPAFSPDGKRIAFESTRSGGSQVWIAGADGSNPVALTSGGRHSGSPRWSPDGRWIVFDRRTEDAQTAIFVVEAAGGRPRQLTKGGVAVMPSFSRDGKWVWFHSNGARRVPVEGGPHDIASVKAIDAPYSPALESADGKSIFCAHPRDGALIEFPLDGGKRRDHPVRAGGRAYQVEADGIWFMEQKRGGANPESMLGHYTPGGRVREIRRVPVALSTGFAVSPDRKQFLFARAEDSGSDIFMMESGPPR